MVRVGREQVVAYRVGAQHLGERLPEGAEARAAAACGVQDSPPGSAAAALHARVAGVSAEGLERLVTEQRSLVRTWAMRGAPFLFPVADFGVFTTGVMPPDEAARRRFILGVGQTLDRLGMGLDEAVELCRAEVRGVLAGRRLDIEPLGAEIAERVAAHLPAAQRRVWQEEGPYAKGQPVGEGVVHFCVRMLTLAQTMCFASREANKAPFVLTEEWLDGWPSWDRDDARAELARRYLRCFGPSTRKDFAAWAGLGAADAEPWWRLVEPELSPVDYDGRRCWMRVADLPELEAPPPPRGVRLLPPRDPYVQLRDRETIVADASRRRAVWRAVGEPGTVLVDGEIAGTWRPRKNGSRLTITVAPFGPLRAGSREEIEEEARALGPLRGASVVAVAFG